MSSETETPVDPDNVPAPTEPPPTEDISALLERYDREFLTWRRRNAESWMHCTRCLDFHKIAFLPLAGQCTRERHEPETAPVPAPAVLPPAASVVYDAFDYDDEDDPRPTKKGGGPKQNAKVQAAEWERVRRHRINLRGM